MTPDEKKAEEYPYDKETQEWMAADLGKPSTPEEVFLLWSNKYDRLLDEHAQVLNKIKSIESEAKQKDERIAELEKEKLNLLTCAANQAEEIQRLERRVKQLEGIFRISKGQHEYWANECSRLKAENEKLAEAAIEKPPYKADLTARLSEALGALKKIYEFHVEEEHDLPEEEMRDIAKAVLTIPDNARLLERERLRNAVIEAVADMHRFYAGKLQKIIGGQKLKERFERLEAHEKEGGSNEA